MRNHEGLLTRMEEKASPQARKLSQGYVRSGDRYVFKGEQAPAPATKPPASTAQPPGSCVPG